jgi:hypothetical protein
MREVTKQSDFGGKRRSKMNSYRILAYRVQTSVRERAWTGMGQEMAENVSAYAMALLL